MKYKKRKNKKEEEIFLKLNEKILEVDKLFS